MNHNDVFFVGNFVYGEADLSTTGGMGEYQIKINIFSDSLNVVVPFVPINFKERGPDRLRSFSKGITLPNKSDVVTTSYE